MGIWSSILVGAVTSAVIALAILWLERAHQHRVRRKDVALAAFSAVRGEVRHGCKYGRRVVFDIVHTHMQAEGSVLRALPLPQGPGNPMVLEARRYYNQAIMTLEQQGDSLRVGNLSEAADCLRDVAERVQSMTTFLSDSAVFDGSQDWPDIDIRHCYSLDTLGALTNGLSAMLALLVEQNRRRYPRLTWREVPDRKYRKRARREYREALKVHWNVKRSHREAKQHALDEVLGDSEERAMGRMTELYYSGASEPE